MSLADLVTQPITLIPYGHDPLAAVATRIVTDHAERLPDLSGVTLLLPEPQQAARLRRLLLEQCAGLGHTALLGPRVETLAGWLNDFPIECGAIPGSVGRELMLVEALRGHRSLFGDASPWLICDTLIELFDELTLNRSELPEQLEPFTRLLGEAYRTGGKIPPPLGREARLVHTLWHAWHEQHRAEGLTDRCQAQLLRLEAAAANAAGPLYLLGLLRFTRSEAALVRALLDSGRATLILQGCPEAGDYRAGAPLTRRLEQLALEPPAVPQPATAYSRFLDAAFDRGAGVVAERAARFRKAMPESPAHGHLTLAEGNGSEAEAAAVDIQVRRWLQEGKGSIAIVTEDRRLARRIRALLERACITIHDAAGWALSTTSAAAALERWLETVEEDFAQQPMLDLLKSPYIFVDQALDQRLAAVYRLEQDLILHEKIGRGLERYRSHLHFRQRRLAWSSEVSAAVEQLLDRLHKSAEPLLKLIDGRPHRPERYLEALQQSLVYLGMEGAFTADPAGARVLQVIATLLAGLPGRNLPMEWIEFRAWLGRALETHNFRLGSNGAPVTLISLAQSDLGHFDAIVIAGCDREHLPAGGGRTPFFNDRVRRELGLATRRERIDEQLHRFRALLEAAPSVCLTLRHEQDGEEIIPSPWVESLRSFHRLAYGEDLLDHGLMALLTEPRNQMIRCDTLDTPLPSTRPAPTLPAARLPERYSASSHQRLIDCPYRFFAADALGLKPLDEIREALAKSDYGERVHRCLEAFHGGIEGLPGPYREPFDAKHRRQAILALEALSHAVFASDLEDNFQHRGWLKQWLDVIPSYIDWQIERTKGWRVAAVEQRLERQGRDGTTLYGRLDRLDHGDEGLAIIDYKSGNAPRQAEVEAGEAVQLPTYALLPEQRVERVEYLLLDAKGARSGAMLEGDGLTQLAEESEARLRRVEAMIREGRPLHAWGDRKACGYCEMDGVCRRAVWS